MNVPRPLFAAGLFFLAAHARAQLAANSPFLPAPGTAAAAPAENNPIELRGIMAMGRAVRFCIYDTARKTSAWVGLDEKGYDFTIKAQDLAHDSVTVEQGGRTFTLPLRETKVASAGQAAMPMPMPGPVGPNAITQSVVLNPTPADEQQRLDAVSAEVRRRRALREQASVQSVQGVPQPVAQPMVQPVAPQPPVQQQGNVQPRQQNQNQRRVRQ